MTSKLLKRWALASKLDKREEKGKKERADTLGEHRRSTGKKPDETEHLPCGCMSEVRAAKEWLGLGQGPVCDGKNEVPKKKKKRMRCPSSP